MSSIYSPENTAARISRDGATLSEQMQHMTFIATHHMQKIAKDQGARAEKNWKQFQSILTEINDSPAICRAPMKIWHGAAKSIASLVKRNNRVAGVLLNMIPEAPYWHQWRRSGPAC